MPPSDDTSNFPKRTPFKRKPYKRTVKLNGRRGRLIKLGAFWGNNDKNGQVYLSGRLGQSPVMLFQNAYKEKDKQPDYFLYLITDPLEEDLQDVLGVERSPKEIKNPLPADKTTKNPYSAPRYLVLEDIPVEETSPYDPFGEVNPLEDDDDVWES